MKSPRQIRSFRSASVQQRDVKVGLTLTTTVFLMSMMSVNSFVHQPRSTSINCVSECSSVVNVLNAITSYAKHKKVNPPFLHSSGSVPAPSSTTLSMAWTAPTSFSMESFTSPFRSFGGWYSEVDATPHSVVYDDMNMDMMAFDTFNDDWPSMTDNELFQSDSPAPTSMSSLSMEDEAVADVKQQAMHRPLKSLKGLAFRAAGYLPIRVPARFRRIQ